VRAVILIPAFALRALHARPYLGSDSDAIADFDGGYCVPDLDGCPDDFVAHAEGQVHGAPPAGYGVHV
jgi:hypothetical protein